MRVRRIVAALMLGAALVGLGATPSDARAPIYCVRECDPPTDPILEEIADLLTCPTSGALCLPPL